MQSLRTKRVAQTTKPLVKLAPASPQVEAGYAKAYENINQLIRSFLVRFVLKPDVFATTQVIAVQKTVGLTQRDRTAFLAQRLFARWISKLIVQGFDEV